MSERMHFNKSIGIWISDKKSQKINWKELNHACNSHGFNLVKLKLERPFEEQGRIDVLLHKLTDIIAAADQGDVKAAAHIRRVEQYLSNHPNVTVIDPLDNVRILLNRYGYYTILNEESSFQNQGIFTSAFAEFSSNNIEQNKEIMRQRGVTFPVICKQTVAHGCKAAHEMVLVFNERGLDVCRPPCVVQTFVNHNAVFYKVFVVGNRYHICERPSLKNFYASDDLEPIFYRTGEVCKVDSHSTLSILDPHEKADIKITPNEEKIKSIIRVIRKKIGLILLGFDVVIDNATGNHAVIDINVFPSYDNFPNFFEHLLECINECALKCNSDSSGSNGSDSLVANCRLNGLINVDESRGNYKIMGMNIIN